jgi:endonuclease/exonuclease/phosphatase (EEP) superfamily protein YafD
MPQNASPAVRRRRRKKKLVTRLDRILRLLAIFLCVATLLGYLGIWWWVLDLFSHFRPLLALVLIPVGGLLIWRKHLWLSVASLSCLILNFWAIVPYLYILPQDDPPKTAQHLKIFHANVLAPNNSYEQLLSQIIQENPDVITLTELTPGWMNGLAALKTQYPYVVHNETQDRFGLAIWSRFPIVRREPQYLGVTQRCAILGLLQLNKRSLSIVAAHPWSPRNADWAESRDQQLELLGQHIAAESGPLVLMGDLNVTPWSHGFQYLQAISQLRDSQLDQGLAPTWPAHLPIRIPIDHCLISEKVHILRRHTGEDFGSDHLPLIVTVAVE